MYLLNLFSMLQHFKVVEIVNTQLITWNLLNGDRLWLVRIAPVTWIDLFRILLRILAHRKELDLEVPVSTWRCHCRRDVQTDSARWETLEQYVGNVFWRRRSIYRFPLGSLSRLINPSSGADGAEARLPCDRFVQLTGARHVRIGTTGRRYSIHRWFFNRISGTRFAPTPAQSGIFIGERTRLILERIWRELEFGRGKQWRETQSVKGPSLSGRVAVFALAHRRRTPADSFEERRRIVRVVLYVVVGSVSTVFNRLLWLRFRCFVGRSLLLRLDIFERRLVALEYVLIDAFVQRDVGLFRFRVGARLALIDARSRRLPVLLPPLPRLDDARQTRLRIGRPRALVAGDTERIEVQHLTDVLIGRTGDGDLFFFTLETGIFGQRLVKLSNHKIRVNRRTHITVLVIVLTGILLAIVENHIIVVVVSAGQDKRSTLSVQREPGQRQMPFAVFQIARAAVQQMHGLPVERRRMVLIMVLVRSPVPPGVRRRNERHAGPVVLSLTEVSSRREESVGRDEPTLVDPLRRRSIVLLLLVNEILVELSGIVVVGNEVSPDVPVDVQGVRLWGRAHVVVGACRRLAHIGASGAGDPVVACSLSLERRRNGHLSRSGRARGGKVSPRGA